MMYHSTSSFKCLPYLLILGCILTFLQACAPVQRHVLFSSDNGDGTYTNPVINADYPDPDIIRVGRIITWLVRPSWQCGNSGLSFERFD